MAATVLSSSDGARRGKITRTFGEVTFSSDFDSGNLDRVEPLDKEDDAALSFALWTAPDCAGTTFENGNSSWYYFKVVTQANFEGNTLRLTIKNLNKQVRLYQQGFSPICKTFPGRQRWERLRGPLSVEITENGQMQLTFDYTINDSHKRTTYFAFCFPFSYTECQQMLNRLDQQFVPGQREDSTPHSPPPEMIYYHRSLLCHSLEGRRVDLLTISSHHGIMEEEEDRLEGLFPDQAVHQARKFADKKVFLLTSRVHPGETPASFVFNGFLRFILRPDDPRAQVLRRKFVFKLIPMLNPDGVARGHYRTSARGLNLNRFYLDPDRALHPSIFAARSVFLYHHLKGHEGMSLRKATTDSPSCSGGLSTASGDGDSNDRGHSSTGECRGSNTEGPSNSDGGTESTSGEPSPSTGGTSAVSESQTVPMEVVESPEPSSYQSNTSESGVAFYVDLHGHAAKRGCFIYGNHFQEEGDQALCMLYPKLISLNSAHFDFSGCLFSEKNMYASDKNGLTKEGSGRVALHKASGHIHCYTLECNYNSGRQVNSLSAATTDGGRATPPPEGGPIPHKFSIEDLEEVGRGVAVAALDYFQVNPWSRLPTSEYGSLNNVKQALLLQVRLARAAKSGGSRGKRVGEGGGMKSSSAGRDHLSHSRVPSESSSSRVGSTRGRGLGDLKVRNGKGRLLNTAVERKVSSIGAGKIMAKSSRTTVKPTLAVMNTSSSSLRIKAECPPKQQTASVPSKSSSTRLLPVMKKPRIPYRMEFLNMKRQMEDKAALLSPPSSSMPLSSQQRVTDTGSSLDPNTTSKVNKDGVIDGGGRTTMPSSPLRSEVVVGRTSSCSTSSSGLSPPRVPHNSDGVERTTVALRWEAKGKLLKRRPSFPPQVSNCVMFSSIDTALVHPATERQLPFCSFVKPKAHSITDLNHSF